MDTDHTTLFTNLVKFVCRAGVRLPDIRLIVMFVWAVLGLIVSESIHLNQWALYRSGQATLASKERPFSRWLHNDRIRPMLLHHRLVRCMGR